MESLLPLSLCWSRVFLFLNLVTKWGEIWIISFCVRQWPTNHYKPRCSVLMAWQLFYWPILLSLVPQSVLWSQARATWSTLYTSKINNSWLGGWHWTQVAFALFTHLAQFFILHAAEIYRSPCLEWSGQRLNNVVCNHSVLQKQFLIIPKAGNVGLVDVVKQRTYDVSMIPGLNFHPASVVLVALSNLKIETSRTGNRESFPRESSPTGNSR